jgi:hypothetical protein
VQLFPDDEPESTQKSSADDAEVESESTDQSLAEQGPGMFLLFEYHLLLRVFHTNYDFEDVTPDSLPTTATGIDSDVNNSRDNDAVSRQDIRYLSII